MTPQEPTPPHGRRSTYQKGCRCDECREASNAYHREYSKRLKAREYKRRYQAENRERINEDSRRWRLANPKKARDIYRRYREANPDLVRERNRRWYAENPEYQLERKRTAAAADPEHWREIRRKNRANRRARKLAIPTESIEGREVWERDNGICGICGEPADPDNWHLDHVIPLALGGHHTYANVQVAHPTCNLRKGARAA